MSKLAPDRLYTQLGKYKDWKIAVNVHDQVVIYQLDPIKKNNLWGASIPVDDFTEEMDRHQGEFEEYKQNAKNKV